MVVNVADAPLMFPSWKTRVAKQVVAERLGPNKKAKQDMLGSFIQHDLTQKQAESEILLQMRVFLRKIFI